MTKPIYQTCQVMSRDEHSHSTIFPKTNSERYQDPTPYAAVHNLEGEKQNANKLYQAIVNICELSGFHIQGKLTIVNSKTGHRWQL